MITGSNGFTATYVKKKLLQRGYDVHGLARHPQDTSTIVGDVTDIDSIKNALQKIHPDFVIHLAGLAFVNPTDNSQMYKVNTLGTTKLLQAIDELGLKLKKIVIASSANVYGNAATQVIDESTPYAPLTHYGASKAAMEFMVKTWFDKLPIIITRPFNYTGPGQAANFLVPKLIRHYQAKSKTIMLGNLDVARDYSDVCDVAEHYVNLMESDADSEVVNICSGRTIALTDILLLLNKISHHTPEIKQAPELIRSNEIKSLRGSDQKLLSISKTICKPIDFETTLTSMFDS